MARREFRGVDVGALRIVPMLVSLLLSTDSKGSDPVVVAKRRRSEQEMYPNQQDTNHLPTTHTPTDSSRRFVTPFGRHSFAF